jgi:ribonuclease III
MTKTREELEKNLGFVFKNKNLLEQALRHRSVSGPGVLSNERLEFLGDAILNFVIAARLYADYSQAGEGDLSRFRANLVNGEVLAAIAKEFKVGDYLALGVGEKKSGGFRRTSILADALEAIIGAIFLDTNFEQVSFVIENWYKSKWKKLLTVEQKDPKTRLQEFLQGKNYPLPEYVVVKTEGLSHEQTFYVECRVENVAKPTLGIGSSKRKAEQDAANNFLESEEAKGIAAKALHL